MRKTENKTKLSTIILPHPKVRVAWIPAMTVQDNRGSSEKEEGY